MTTKTATPRANELTITKLIPIRDRAKLGFAIITATRPIRERAK